MATISSSAYGRVPVERADVNFAGISAGPPNKILGPVGALEAHCDDLTAIIGRLHAQQSMLYQITRRVFGDISLDAENSVVMPSEQPSIDKARTKVRFINEMLSQNEVLISHLENL